MKAGIYWIAYNSYEGYVEWSKNEPSWDAGMRCWSASGPKGILFRSSYRGGPIQVYLTDKDFKKIEPLDE